MKGKFLIFFNFEEAVSDMAMLKGSSVLLPHETFRAFPVAVVDQRVAVILYHLL